MEEFPFCVAIGFGCVDNKLSDISFQNDVKPHFDNLRCSIAYLIQLLDRLWSPASRFTSLKACLSIGQLFQPLVDDDKNFGEEVLVDIKIYMPSQPLFYHQSRTLVFFCCELSSLLIEPVLDLRSRRVPQHVVFVLVLWSGKHNHLST